MHNYSKQYIYEQYLPSNEMVSYRNFLCSKFRKMLSNLQDSIKLNPVSARSGKLDMSKLHGHNYNENIFKTSEVISGNSTTIIFLVDASCSMNVRTHIPFGGTSTYLTSFEMCKTIVSAFAKACSDIKIEGIDVELMMKHEFSEKPQIVNGELYTGHLLSRVYGSKEKSRTTRNVTFDNLLKVKMHTPFKGVRGDCGTPELCLLPGLKKWIVRNVSTDNVFVVNLTDGAGNSNFGKRGGSIGSMDTETSALFNRKYGGWLNMTTVYIGHGKISDSWREQCGKMYGDNFLACGTNDLPVNLHKALRRHIKKNVIK